MFVTFETTALTENFKKTLIFVRKHSEFSSNNAFLNAELVTLDNRTFGTIMTIAAAFTLFAAFTATCVGLFFSCIFLRS